MKPPVTPLLTALLTLGGAESLQTETVAGQSLQAAPLLVSPGGRAREGHVGTGCPTFSWAETQPAAGYSLIVYEVGSSDEREVTGEPLLQADFPAGVSSWTPEMSECLPPGRYGWAVAAVGTGTREERALRWSKPAVFRVEGTAAEGKVTDRAAQSAGALPDGGIVSALLPLAAATADSAPRTITGSALFDPPLCSSDNEMFGDVPADDDFCPWIEQAARDGFTTGCGGGNYCPDAPVTRRQMAMILEKAMRGTLTFAPPPGGAKATVVDDSENNVGQYSSIAIGADDLPVISYYDLSNGALKSGALQRRRLRGGDSHHPRRPGRRPLYIDRNRRRRLSGHQLLRRQRE